MPCDEGISGCDASVELLMSRANFETLQIMRLRLDPFGQFSGGPP
jgi:hypothetical protein